MIEMSQVFTIHDAKLCENCNEPMKEMQVNSYICLCCGLTED
jgi:hypothetical protein